MQLAHVPRTLGLLFLLLSPVLSCPPCTCSDQYSSFRPRGYQAYILKDLANIHSDLGACLLEWFISSKTSLGETSFSRLSLDRCSSGRSLTRHGSYSAITADFAKVGELVRYSRAFMEAVAFRDILHRNMMFAGVRGPIRPH
ncbi:hypothetical protein BDZ89DRAFT_199334 [Hymenopellis radicata]|nr:hypothetical protein BDZ89DRAFT_199334 [Hymenopellis radicata]